MKDLPRIKVIANLENPEVKTAYEMYKTGEITQSQYDKLFAELDYWVKEEVLAEVMMWNINKGTVRCRAILEDGSKHPRTGSPINTSDKALREAFELVPKS